MKKLINRGFISLGILLIGLDIRFAYTDVKYPAGDSPDGNYYNIVSFIIIGTEFILISLGFVFFGVLTMRTLKENFNNFYSENYWSLVFATSSLSIPLFIRGLLNTLNGVSMDFNTFTSEYEYFYKS